MKPKYFLSIHLDFFGFSASFLCAVHCAVAPVLILIAGFSDLAFLESPWFEGIILTSGIFLALFSLLPSLSRKHQNPLALVIMLTGFALIAFSKLFLSSWWEVFCTTTGATVIAVAHYVNWRLVKQNENSYVREKDPV